MDDSDRCCRGLRRAICCWYLKDVGLDEGEEEAGLSSLSADEDDEGEDGEEE
jgi:hypothetical protein